MWIDLVDGRETVLTDGRLLMIIIRGVRPSGVLIQVEFRNLTEPREWQWREPDLPVELLEAKEVEMNSENMILCRKERIYTTPAINGGLLLVCCAHIYH